MKSSVPSNPTPEQHAEMSQWLADSRKDLDTLVRVYECDRFNGGDRVMETMRLFTKMGDHGTADSLAMLLAVAISRLAETDAEATP